jgi:hypothetical protein
MREAVHEVTVASGDLVLLGVLRLCALGEHLGVAFGP